MSVDRNVAVKVCALGFDPRAYAALKFFFKGQTGQQALLVEIHEADVGIVDVDSVEGKKQLKAFREQFPERAVILVSLEPPADTLDSTVLRITKPLSPESLSSAIESLRPTIRRSNTELRPAFPSVAGIEVVEVLNASELPELNYSGVSDLVAPSDNAAVTAAPLALQDQAETADAESEKPKQPALDTGQKAVRRIFSAGIIPKSITHAAMLLDARGFGEYIGSLKDIDPTNPEEIRIAQYEPRRFFQGYLHAACQRAKDSSCAMRLYTGWKPVTIFPQSRELVMNADEQQLRAFCLVPVHSIADLDYCDPADGIMTIKPAAQAGMNATQREDIKIERIETFVWKVSLWTSAGRIPSDVSLTEPIYLLNWPNLTRLLVFPHAMRIAALLSERPRSILDVIQTLEIRQQYAFAFVSAARALGLIELNESGVAAEPPMADVKAAPAEGFLKRILRRMFGR